MTATRPLRLITLHFSQIFLTDALTFMIGSLYGFRRFCDTETTLTFVTRKPRPARICMQNRQSVDKRLIVHQSFILYVILPRVRSYGVSSTRTLSPGSILIKFLRILPEICANTLCPLSSSTRNMALGKDSRMVPSNSMTPCFVTQLPQMDA